MGLMDEANIRSIFVGAEEDDRLLGTYYLRFNLLGGGAHVANCGYMTASDPTGRGVARRMCEHSCNTPATAASGLCNSTSLLALTSER